MKIEIGGSKCSIWTSGQFKIFNQSWDKSFIDFYFDFWHLLVVLASSYPSQSNAQLYLFSLKHRFQLGAQQLLSSLFFIGIHCLPVYRLSTLHWDVVTLYFVLLFKLCQDLFQRGGLDVPLVPNSKGGVADAMLDRRTRLSDLDKWYCYVDKAISPSRTSSCKLHDFDGLKSCYDTGCSAEGG